MPRVLATLKVAQDQAAEASAAEKIRIAAAFQEVFGQPNKRDSAQKLVMEYLEKGCEVDSSDFDFSKEWDGMKTAMAAASVSGYKNALKVIYRQLERAAKNRSS